MVSLPISILFAMAGTKPLRPQQCRMQREGSQSKSVTFKTDGKEAFHSRVIRRANLARYQVDVTGVKVLELIVNSENARNAGTWGLWLDPTLSR